MATIFVALTCYQSSASEGAAELAHSVLRAAEKAAPPSPVQVYLDEALGFDAQIFSEVPFLPTEHAICVLAGDEKACTAMATTMVKLGRKTILSRRLANLSESLRLQALVSSEGFIVSEESPYFDAGLLEKSALHVERLPAGMPLCL